MILQDTRYGFCVVCLCVAKYELISIHTSHQRIYKTRIYIDISSQTASTAAAIRKDQPTCTHQLLNN